MFAAIPFAAMAVLLALIVAGAWWLMPEQSDMCEFYRDLRESEQAALEMCENSDSCHVTPDDFRYLEWLGEKEEATCGYVDQ